MNTQNTLKIYEKKEGYQFFSSEKNYILCLMVLAPSHWFARTASIMKTWKLPNLGKSNDISSMPTIFSRSTHCCKNMKRFLLSSKEIKVLSKLFLTDFIIQILFTWKKRKYSKNSITTLITAN